MVYFGVDYYPEHWPEARWSEEAGLMAAAGFNVVRLAEFAWAKLEPTRGQFDFDWLDRAIDLLASASTAGGWKRWWRIRAILNSRWCTGRIPSGCRKEGTSRSGTTTKSA